MPLVLAGLVADGMTRMSGINHLARGYEQMPQKLQKLGAIFGMKRIPQEVKLRMPIQSNSLIFAIYWLSVVLFWVGSHFYMLLTSSLISFVILAWRNLLYWILESSRSPSALRVELPIDKNHAACSANSD